MRDHVCECDVVLKTWMKVTRECENVRRHLKLECEAFGPDCVVAVGTITGFSTRTKHGKNGHTCGECHKTRARREHLLMTQGAGPMPAWKTPRYAVVAASAT